MSSSFRFPEVPILHVYIFGALASPQKVSYRSRHVKIERVFSAHGEMKRYHGSEKDVGGEVQVSSSYGNYGWLPPGTLGLDKLTRAGVNFQFCLPKNFGPIDF